MMESGSFRGDVGLKHRIHRAACLCLALALAACVNLDMPEPAPASAPARLTELPPQALMYGDCAVFFWSANPPHRFVVFDGLSQGGVQILINGRVHEFATDPRLEPFLVGDTYARQFEPAERIATIGLEGVFGTISPEGLRMDRSLMRLGFDDGSQIVMPLIGHYTCRRDQQAVQGALPEDG